MNSTALTLAAMTIAAAMLVACASPSTPTTPNAAQAASAPPAFMYFTSQRSASDIAQCLSGRVHGLSKNVAGDVTELSVGGRPGNAAWLIALTPTHAGTVIKVLKSSDASAESEPKMRFDIARCAV